jgi:hypothetical protein
MPLRVVVGLPLLIIQEAGTSALFDTALALLSPERHTEPGELLPKPRSSSVCLSRWEKNQWRSNKEGHSSTGQDGASRQPSDRSSRPHPPCQATGLVQTS